MELPKEKIKASRVNPKILLIFSKPKTGKTELVSALDDCLVLDFENGTEFIDSLSIKIEKWQDIIEIGNLIKERGTKYKYVAMDTLSSFEKICLPYAEKLYSQTPMGKNWYKKDESGKLSASSGKHKYKDITQLPDGAGYYYTRAAFHKLSSYISNFGETMIQLAHVKEIAYMDKDDKITTKEISLTGKLKEIIPAEAHAIAYMYRKGENNILSFHTNDNVICGARAKHLGNKEIVISEMIDDEIIYHWDKIFINNK